MTSASRSNRERQTARVGPDLVSGPPRHCNSSARTQGPALQKPAILLLAALTLPACATKQLTPDFTEISASYAEDMNYQMLLNLARLDQGHPAYFMAIGEVRISRTQNTTVQAGANSSNTQDATTAAAVTQRVTQVLGGNFTGTAQSGVSPSFLFIPINSEEASKQLLSPIPVEVFATLYEQGWPVDQLLRVLVERIEVRFDAADQPPILLVNSPTRANAELFSRFLRTCEVIRELQARGGLRLATEEAFVSLGEAEVDGGKLAPKDINDSADKGRIWQRSPNGSYVLGTRRNKLRFVADDRVVESTLATFKQTAATDPLRSAFASERGQIEIRNIEAVLRSRPEIKSGRPEDQGKSDAPARPGVQTTLVLRSFRNLLEAVAQEQRAFDELAQQTPFLSGLPERQKRPVLRTDWLGRDEKLTGTVATVHYADRDYTIADPADVPAASLDSRWNRDIFRLLLNLSSQVTVDITKFQRQVLELTQ